MAKAQAQEPSMEEILASIRRIIADEEPADKAGAEDAAKPVETTPKPADEADGKGGETVDEEDLDRMFAEGAKDQDGEEKSAVGVDPDEQPLELTEELAEPEDADDLVEPSLGEIEDVTFTDPAEPAPAIAEETPPAERKAAPKPEPAPAVKTKSAEPEDPDALLAGSTDQAVASAFDMLSGTIRSDRARTLEDVAKEAMRPMLKAWLDQNLPGLVKRLVQAEIERIARNAGR